MSAEHVQTRPLAIVTGAAGGVGLELAAECAKSGFDLIVAADQPLGEAVARLRSLGAEVRAVPGDPSTAAAVDALIAAAANRPIEVLIANAGHGLGHGFLNQDFEAARRVIDTHIAGTVCLIHRVARDMRWRGRGRILITGSTGGFSPGSFQAIYTGTKAFIDSFSRALRNELTGTGVQITCLMPGVSDAGLRAMMDGEGDMVASLRHKLQGAMADITPSPLLA